MRNNALTHTPSLGNLAPESTEEIQDLRLLSSGGSRIFKKGGGAGGGGHKIIDACCRTFNHQKPKGGRWSKIVLLQKDLFVPFPPF